jgi:hypothetical protein
MPIEEDVAQRLLELLAQTALLTAQPADEPLDLTTVPLRDIPGFDSLLAVETGVVLAGEFGCVLEGKGKQSVNLFVSEDGTRALSVAEIAGRLTESLRPLVYGR